MNPHSSTTRTILVTGATGQVGRHLVRELLAAGVRVRALTRSPQQAGLPKSVDVVEGEFAHLPEGVFDGVDAAFVFPADNAADLAKAAAGAGVPHLVLLSSLAAAMEHPRDHGSASQIHHSAIEEEVMAGGAEWTILRPGTFANNLLSWAQPIRFTGGVTGPYPSAAQAPIHEADVAAAAATVLTTRGHHGRIYPLTGPQTISRADQVATIAAAIGREITFTESTPEEFASQMTAYGVNDDIVKMLLDYWSDTVDRPDVVRSPELVTGKTPRTLAEWANDHAADFGG